MLERTPGPFPWREGIQWILKGPRVLHSACVVAVHNHTARRERAAWLCRLTGATAGEVRCYVREIESDRALIIHLRDRYRRYTTYLPSPVDFMVEPTGGGSMFFHCVSLYVLVRVVRPHVVVETGGTPGKSSAFILRAMERNGIGELYTIDLPPVQSGAPVIALRRSHDVLPRGVTANWCVPDALRGRHHLVLGSAQEHLPALLHDLRQIDIFIHDSDHSYGHMFWEFRTAFPYIRQGGYLWSDDIRANTAWHEFCAEQRLNCEDFFGQGVVRKP